MERSREGMKEVEVILKSRVKPIDSAAIAEIGDEGLGRGCSEFCLGHCEFGVRDGPWESPQ